MLRPVAGPAVVGIEEEVRLTVEKVQYVLIPTDTFVELNTKASDPILFIVYPTQPGDTISQDKLRRFRTDVLERDDVFQPAFGSTVVFYGSNESDLDIEPDVPQELAAWGTVHHVFVAGDTSSKVAPGPYVFVKTQVWQPWRVYYDFNATFMCTFKPSPARLDAPEAGTDGRVIVPSRCYYKPSASRPLDGARIGVKDSIDIAGHKTTLNNRAWRELYPPATKHAHCVQLLLDAGAIIVGKLKLQALIVREEPVEAVEFTDPFNPRGDGYQVPSGSSSGSAAAIGSYDWLDFSVGSDTNGSVRKPAHYNGCHTIRPTTGIMNNDGVVGQFPEFDMPGFFGRDITKFTKFISVWYGNSPRLRAPPKAPVKILYPRDYLPTSNAEQTRVIDQFVSGLESALGVKRTEISITQRWEEDAPDGKEHDDIAKYLDTAGIYPFFHDGYYALEPFRKEYQEKFGKAPFVHRYVEWQWSVARDISTEERDECWRRCEVYRHWLLNKIFEADDKGSISIMVFPIEVGQPNYRDSPEPPYGLLNGYASLNMSPIMRAPEVTAIGTF
ncbi:hypothetical protein ACHAPT_006149 [Fusarium lateritium]